MRRAPDGLPRAWGRCSVLAPNGVPPGEACPSTRPRAPKPALAGLHDAGHPEGRCYGRGAAWRPRLAPERKTRARNLAAFPRRAREAQRRAAAVTCVQLGGARGRGPVEPRAPLAAGRALAPGKTRVAAGAQRASPHTGPDVLDAPRAPDQWLGTVA